MSQGFDTEELRAEMAKIDDDARFDRQRLTWSGSLANGAALVAATNVVANVDHPDTALAFLMPSLLLFALGLIANSVGTLAFSVGRTERYDHKLRMVRTLEAASALEAPGGDLAKQARTSHRAAVVFASAANLPAPPPLVEPVSSKVIRDLLGFQRQALEKMPAVAAKSHRTVAILWGLGTTAVLLSLLLFALGCAAVGAAHFSGSRLQPAQAANTLDTGGQAAQALTAPPTPSSAPRASTTPSPPPTVKSSPPPPSPPPSR